MVATGISMMAVSSLILIDVIRINGKKFADNKQRDQCVLSQLRNEGWRVAVIWECTTRRNNEFEDAINRLDEFIKAGDGWYFETDYRES